MFDVHSKGVRCILAGCIVTAIQNKYPEHNGEYVGHKFADAYDQDGGRSQVVDFAAFDRAVMSDMLVSEEDVEIAASAAADAHRREVEDIDARVEAIVGRTNDSSSDTSRGDDAVDDDNEDDDDD